MKINKILDWLSQLLKIKPARDLVHLRKLMKVAATAIDTDMRTVL